MVSHLNGIRLLCRDMTGSDVVAEAEVYDGADVKVDGQYAGVGHRASEVATLV